MGNEDQTDCDAEEKSTEIDAQPLHDSTEPTLRARLAAADRVVGPLVTFVFVYLVTLLLVRAVRGLPDQWGALISVIAATAISIFFWERDGWNLGLRTAPRIGARELIVGVLFAVAAIGAADLLIVAFTDFHHTPGRGFPWWQLGGVFLPAVLHEELMFRGYPFQKLWRWNRVIAILFVSTVFAGLHAGNRAVTALAMVNIYIAGVLLSLAWERYRRLWFPIGIHLGWNLFSGPVLGHEVSGFVSRLSVFRTVDPGAPWLTGGDFGIEGSLLMTVVEVAAVALLWWQNARIRLTVDRTVNPSESGRGEQ